MRTPSKKGHIVGGAEALKNLAPKKRKTKPAAEGVTKAKELVKNRRSAYVVGAEPPKHLSREAQRKVLNAKPSAKAAELAKKAAQVKVKNSHASSSCNTLTADAC